MAAWKEPIQRRVLDARGMRGVVIPSARGYYVIGNGLKSTAAELTEAAAVAAGAVGAVPGSDEGSPWPPRRLLRRSAATRSRYGGGQGPLRARLASQPSGARGRAPPRQLPQLTGSGDGLYGSCCAGGEGG